MPSSVTSAAGAAGVAARPAVVSGSLQGAPSAQGSTASAGELPALWLSRLVMTRPQQVRDVYALHQLLWKAFAGARHDRPFLFRADTVAATEDEGPRGIVLVQSECEPDWASLGDRVADVKHKPMPCRHAAGDQLRFFVRANPTACRKGLHEYPSLTRDEFRARRGKRVALWRPDEQIEWLQRKATTGGFEVNAVRTSQSRPWRWSRGETRARHDGVDFEGVLRVADAVAFARTISTGLGPAKAFGFGLLSLAPLGDRQGAPPAERA